jgi:type IV pilus assembly protein PilN
MIRINLLAVERGRSKKKFTFPVGQKLTVICSLVLVGGALLVGWRYLSLNQQLKRLDADILAAQQETARLHSVIKQVQEFEQQKAQLQQRVVLIEQLRKSQTGPVHMLDQISRALPEMLWLTGLKQSGNEVVLEGKSTTLTAVSDFVANLEATGYFKKSADIVTSSESSAQPAGELTKFSIKAIFQPAAESVTAAAAAPAAPGAPGAPGAAGPGVNSSPAAAPAGTPGVSPKQGL